MIDLGELLADYGRDESLGRRAAYVDDTPLLSDFAKAKLERRKRKAEMRARAVLAQKLLKSRLVFWPERTC